MARVGCRAVVWLAAGVAMAQGQVEPAAAPSFAAPKVPLAPGLILSLYGNNLGPATGCLGEADPQRREIPSPARPHQSDLELRIYPTALCDTQVFVAGIPAGLLYVQAGQINFKVPQEIPAQGPLEIRVAYRSRSGLNPSAPMGSPNPTISLESPARVGMPVWLKVTLPGDLDGNSIQYPFLIWPAAFGCNQVEVRRDGVLLPRIADLNSQAFHGIVFSGFLCGSVSLSTERHFKGRIPLHLQYRFDRPGIYEVRYIRSTDWTGVHATAETDWTPIEVLPETAGERRRWLTERSAHAPLDDAGLLSDFLPGILGVPDEQSLRIVREYLFDADRTVREYAMYGLTYWPPREAAESVWERWQAKGPSDTAVEFLLHQREFLSAHSGPMVESAMAYLGSESTVALQGALRALHGIAFEKDSAVSGPVRARAAEELCRAEEHVIEADPKDLNEYASTLGLLSDPHSHQVLWDLVNRGVAAEQAMIALTWRKDPADLPKLAQFAAEPAKGPDAGRSRLPYALHNAYGALAVPFLENMLAHSESRRVRTESAQELVVAGRPSGFAFVADSIERGMPDSRELSLFVRGRFPELAKADDAAVLRFVKARAAAQ